MIDLTRALDRAHATAVGLTDRIERDGVAERRAALPLEGLLAMHSRMTFGDRRTLTTAAAELRTLPNLRAAFHAGIVGWAQVRRVVADLRGIDAGTRAQLDAGFADRERLQRMDPDQVVDELSAAVDRHRAAQEQQRTVRRIEQRFLHIQPALDGALTGYFELDPEAGATFLEGLDAASPRPTAGERDVTRDALDDEGDDAHDANAGGAANTSEDPVTPDGRPVRRSRARQRADGLLALAEAFLAGTRADGSPRRARPRMLVTCELRTLVGDDAHARTARLLWRMPGAPPALTGAAVRRLASDADLRFILVDGSEVLGVQEATSAIPVNVRAAVQARDQGCRFPGCAAPIAHCDLHHVLAREDHGPTTVDNLVAICRRHHTAVTEGRWKLTMTSDGTVTVRRGRRQATRVAPARRAHGPPPRGGAPSRGPTGHRRDAADPTDGSPGP